MRNSLFNINVNLIIIILICTNYLFSQEDESVPNSAELKTFVRNPISVIQSNYLGNDGSPSHETFLIKNGLFPRDKRLQITPYFKISVIQKNIIENGDKIKIDNLDEILNLDFYIEKNEKYYSTNIANPIWDGRVYEENNELIVGGYSSKNNERPVGKINENGNFTVDPSLNNPKEFPILKLKQNNILFDPFEQKLLKIIDSENKVIQKVQNSYLPISLYTSKKDLIENVECKIENKIGTSFLILYAIIDKNKYEIAKCDITESQIVSQTEGYQPKLISGATQYQSNNIITITFEGYFTEDISVEDSFISLKTLDDIAQQNHLHKNSKILIDGDFQDWRNVSGVSDYTGDYVSYLFNNPDTDLLEFKVTNDDKYLYLYTRVAGAHGRTGDKGRYYWYAYIDADRNPSTGYAPTRDDNCYFGVPIGDDTEAQFEFIGNSFIKTFFGFTGMGNEKEVLSGKLNLGQSFYSAIGSDGKKRNKYKVEYVNREGSRFITHDYTAGTSEDIIIALSPDASEVEVRVDFDGFLSDQLGNKLIHPNKIIDIAVGLEASSDYYGSDTWGADSSPVIYNYEIK